MRFCGDAKRQAAFTDDLAYGPTNLDAYKYIKPERAALLPTAKENLQGMRLPDPKWWQQNRQAVTERFNAWIIG